MNILKHHWAFTESVSIEIDMCVALCQNIYMGSIQRVDVADPVARGQA